MNGGRLLILISICVGVALLIWLWISGASDRKNNISLPSRHSSEQDTEQITPVPGAKPRSGPVPAVNNRLTSAVREKGDEEPGKRMTSASSPSSKTDSLPDSSADESTQRQVERFKDTSIPISKRRKELARLSERADARAAEILMALGEEHTYLNAEAIEALGKVKAPGVKKYLRNKLTHSDPKALSAVIRSIAAQEGKDSIQVIINTLTLNRERPDGFQDMVCAACVDALGRIGSPAAIPALDAELRETVGPILQYDYGSKVVSALRAIDDPAARPVLEAYADRIEAIVRRAPDNPMGRRYLLEKIKEARETAANLGKGNASKTNRTKGLIQP